RARASFWRRCPGSLPGATGKAERGTAQAAEGPGGTMRRRPLLASVALVLMPVICLLLPDHQPSLERGVAALPVLSALAVVGRSVYLEAEMRRRVGRLVIGDAPPALLASMARTGSGPVRYVVSCYPAAFCAAALRPAIHVTEGLVERLRPSELDAVLIHE